MLSYNHMEKNTLQKYIATGAAVACFLFFFGGSVFFVLPHIFVLDLFRVNIGHSQLAVAGVEPNIDGQQVANGLDEQKEEVTAKELLGIMGTKRLDGLVSFLNVEEGTGAEAVETSTVSVGYIGTYINNQGQEVEFDRNTNPETPFSFPMGTGSVIPGFEAGVIGMREGGVRIILIKPEAGYGNQQAGSIPPNTELQFVIELYEVQ